MPLPKVLYVREVKERDGSMYFATEKTVAECIDGDGPSVIGVYELKRKTTARKVVKAD